MPNDVSQARRLIQECLETQNPYLDLGYCGITDLDEIPELFECTHLQTLILSNKWYDFKEKKYLKSQNKGFPNKITKLSNGFLQLTKLQTLKISGYYERFEVKDLEVLSKLNQLKSLDLRLNQISDISPLKDLKQLNELNLSYNQISDITPLKAVNQLNSLNLSDNKIADIQPLEKLSNLTELKIWRNQISDITPLKALNQLNSLDLSYNQISDITPLKALNQLN